MASASASTGSIGAGAFWQMKRKLDIVEKAMETPPEDEGQVKLVTETEKIQIEVF